MTAAASECGNVYKCHRLTDDEELERERGKRKKNGRSEIRRCGERKKGRKELIHHSERRHVLMLSLSPPKLSTSGRERLQGNSTMRYLQTNSD